MNNDSQSWLQDDSPVKQKIARVFLFLTSFSWVNNSIEDYAGGSTPFEKLVTRMLPLAIVALFCITCEHRDKIKTVFRTGLWPLLWYVVFSVFCGLASIQPMLCAWKGVEILIALMYVCVTCRDADSTRREVIAFCKLIEILMWTTIALALISPSRGFIPSPSIIPWIQGYLPILNPNAVGFLSVIALTRLLFFDASHKGIRLMVIAVTLLCAQSRTSYAVTCVALAIFVIESLRKKHFGPAIAGCSLVAVALLFSLGWHEQILKVLARGESAEEISSLSGRTVYWDYAIDHIDWMGKGLATGSRSLIFERDNPFHLGLVGTHNSFIEALLGGGYIGAIPYVAMVVIHILRQGIQAITKPNACEGFFFVCAIIFAARSMTSTVLALFSFDFIFMMLFWFWLYTRNMGSNFGASRRRQPPKPVVYEKTLHEQAMEKEQITCQTAQSE